MKYFSRIFKYLDNLKIATRITLGFIVVILSLVSLSFTFFRNIALEKENLRVVNLVTMNSMQIVDVEREIAEIQKLISLYSSTGSSTILKRVSEKYNILNDRLEEVRKTTENNKRQALVLRLQELLMKFGGEIDQLEKRFVYRKNLFDVLLPETYYEGEKIFKERIEELRSKGINSELVETQQLQLTWYDLHYKTKQFLNEKKYRFKKDVYKSLKKIKQSRFNAPRFEESLKKFANDYRSRFDQATQANRMYMSLVSVVMTGIVVEFSSVSKILRDESFAELDRLKKESDENNIANIRLIYINLLIVILFLIGISIYFHKSIVKRITEIADTFRGFISGDFDIDIPGLERRDEIGQLAKAADSFREVSIKMKEGRAEAEQLADSKTRFLANMSHEIRTPMNAVLSCTKLLADEIENEEHVDLLNTIQASGDSLLVIINDILDFSKMESERLELEKTSFNLSKCIGNVLELLSAGASEKGVELIYEEKPNLPDYVIGDVVRVKQVLLNMMGNAIKFTNDEVILSVDVTQIGQEEFELKFTVIDNGIGIADSDIKYLFKNFKQLDSSTTRKYGGTGLGLSISKTLAEAMDGKIWYESEIGEGACFIFTVNVLKGYKEVDEISSAKIKADENMATKFPLKILMAEDNSINTKVAVKMIAKLGYEMEVVENGRAAVDMMKNGNYDVILMDQHMPEMDGVEATREIRKLPIKQPKIFALTASAFDEDRKRCLEAGMDGFLTKPIDLDEIAKALLSCKN